MLNALRKRASGWVAQLFIALLVLSFAVWGVADIFTGFRGDTVATVGATDVTIQSFLRQYDNDRRQLERQIRQPITPDQARLFGLPGQVLGRLVTEATLDDQARSLGLGISGDTLAQQIADDPSFRGAGGAFDRNQFAQTLRSAGFTEDQYVERLREQYVRQQIADALIGGVEVPQAYLRAMHEFSKEARSISYLVLSPAAGDDVGTPTDSDLAAYFEANKDDWRAPELRSVRIMRLTPADLADTGGISDDAAREVYDDQLTSRYTTPERRQVSQIVFEDRADADEAAADLEEGKTFDDLIAERQLKAEDVSLGLIGRDAILDPAVADAAFGLAANTTSDVVDGRFGPVIVHVSTIVPEAVEPFEAVKQAIKQELAERQAAAEIADQLDVIEDARAGGQTLDEIAANYDLEITEIAAIDSDGQDASGAAIADLPGGDEMVRSIFETDVGIENNPIALDQGYAWYDVTAVEPARDRDLAEVREQVVEAWRQDQIDQDLTAKANALRDRLADGESLAALAAEQGVTAATAEGLTRSSQPPSDLSAAALEAAFGGPVGHAAVAPAAEAPAKVVLVVTAADIPPFFSGSPDLAESEQQLSGQIANDLLQQYVSQLQEQLGVRVNQAALQQAISLPGS